MREVAAKLETIDPSRPATPLVPADECRALIAAGDRLSTPCTPEEATEFAETLVGLYRGAEVANPAVFLRGLAATLALFPAHISRRVVSPVDGLPSRLKFLPSIAELREALDVEAGRQRTLIARARWVLQETERRRIAAEERTALDATRVSPERVAEILATVRLRPAVDEPTTEPEAP